MPIARSRVTSQGQISIPALVRKKLGITSGSVLEWYESGDSVILRRAGTFSSEDIHRVLFPAGKPKARTLEELKEGIRQRTRARYARR